MPLNEWSEPMSLTAICFWVAYIGGICAAIMNPVAGVVLYVLVYHLNPEFQWWGKSVQVVGLRTSLTVAAATLAGIWLRWPRFEGRARQFSLPVVFMIALVAYGILSLWIGVGVHWRGVHHADKAIKVLVFVLILIRCVRHPLHYQLVIGSWLLGVLYIGYEAWGEVGQVRGGRLSHGIGGPDFAESSDLAVHMVATLPLIGAFFFMARTWLGRSFALLTGAMAVNTIVLTRTRNAFVGVAAMAVIAAFSLPKRYRLKGCIAIVVGTLLAVQLTDPAWWNRMSTILHYEQDVAVSARFEYWQAALAMVRDHPFGIGMGNFHSVVIEYVPWLDYERSAHNTYMACLAELGIPGFALFMLVIFGTMAKLRSVRRSADRLPATMPIMIGPFESRFHLGWHAMALRTGLVGYLVCSIFTTRLWAEDLWILLALGTCLWNVTEYMKLSVGDVPSLVTFASSQPDNEPARPLTGAGPLTAMFDVRH